MWLWFPLSESVNSYINSQRASRDSIKGLVDSDEALKTDGKDIANILNDHFSSVVGTRSVS
jgi:hypothetical protein